MNDYDLIDCNGISEAVHARIDHCDWCDRECDHDDLLDAETLGQQYVGMVCCDCYGTVETTQNKEKPMIANQYDLTEIPPGIVPRTEENSSDRTVIKWSGEHPIPAIGDRVRATFNQLGNGTVVSYFIEAGYFGVWVKLTKPPAWHNRQCKGTKHYKHAGLFGTEIEPLPRRKAKSAS